MCSSPQSGRLRSIYPRPLSLVQPAFSQPLPCCLPSLTSSSSSLQCPRLTRVKYSRPRCRAKRVRMEVSNSKPERNQSEADSEEDSEQSIDVSGQEQRQPQAQKPLEDDDDEEEEEEEIDVEVEEEASYADYQAIFEEDGKPLWDTLDVSKALEPLTEEEKQRLRSKLPKQLANFLIRRAEAAVRLRNTKPGDSTFIGNFLKDLPPDRIAWDDPENEEFRDYVYETTTGPPSYRRQGSSLFGGGDGLPDMEDLPDVEGPVETSTGLRGPKKLMSMFVGNVNSVDEQAAKVGYTLLALFVLFIAGKIGFALITFFLSFTFSFLSIFALSAGIFVVFYLFRF